MLIGLVAFEVVYRLDFLFSKSESVTPITPYLFKFVIRVLQQIFVYHATIVVTHLFFVSIRRSEKSPCPAFL